VIDKMSSIDLDVLYEVLFSPTALIKTYEDRHRDSNSRGLDRLNGSAFGSTSIAQLQIASRKCLNGSYKFTPYLESLKLKDRSSPPRMISIPTVRDRIILTQLNRFLRFAFKEESQLRLASEYVREVSDELRVLDPVTNWTAGLDVRRFYDTINRDRIGKLMRARLKDSAACNLILRAVATPTVPKNYKRRDIAKYRTETGVPQGLSISNSLAAIYMHEIDTPMQGLGVKYFRFVDDVLLVGSKEDTAKAAKSFAARARARGLSIHNIGSEKGHHLPLSSQFSYLGYEFRMPLVTVRESTIERLLLALAAKITDFKYNKARTLARKPYLTEKTLRDAFLDELDERISGAISGNRRYGWIAYFSQISDESILHKIDSAIRKMLLRSNELKTHVPFVKRFARSFFEIRFKPEAGYVRNYDRFKTVSQKLDFLVFRGEIGPAVALTEEQINERFDAYRDRQLSEMLADEAVIY